MKLFTMPFARPGIREGSRSSGDGHSYPASFILRKSAQPSALEASPVGTNAQKLTTIAHAATFAFNSPQIRTQHSSTSILTSR